MILARIGAASGVPSSRPMSTVCGVVDLADMLRLLGADGYPHRSAYAPQATRQRGERTRQA